MLRIDVVGVEKSLGLKAPNAVATGEHSDTGAPISIVLSQQSGLRYLGPAKGTFYPMLRTAYHEKRMPCSS